MVRSLLCCSAVIWLRQSANSCSCFRFGPFWVQTNLTKRLMSESNAIGKLWERFLQIRLHATWCSGAKIHHIACGCCPQAISHCQNPLLLEGQEPFLGYSGPT
ncbi:hypothetical protein SCA6_011591 [Theobroma cacao]